MNEPYSEHASPRTRPADSMCFAQTAALWEVHTEHGPASEFSAVFRAQKAQK